LIGQIRTYRPYKGFLPYAVLAGYVSLLLENEMLVYRYYERRYRITEKGLRFLRLYGELRQLISTKQKERIQEQDTFNGYRWPYQVSTTDQLVGSMLNSEFLTPLK